MTASSEARRVLEDATEDAYVFSTHDHLRPMDGHPRPMSLVALLKDSYAALAFRDADGSPHGMATTNRLDAALGWQDVAPVVSRMRSTSAFRILHGALVELYGFEDDIWSEPGYEALDRAIAERYADAGWLSEALDRARVIGVIWDNFWKPGEWRVPDDRFAPSMRIDSSVAAVDAQASDYVGCNVIRDWAVELGIDVRTLDDLEELIDPPGRCEPPGRGPFIQGCHRLRSQPAGARGPAKRGGRGVRARGRVADARRAHGVR